WYLAYLITLKYLEKVGNTILLLDDPAVFLHEKGQRDFLRTLEEISETNQIFYTTHLISLFEENNLEKVMLVNADENTRSSFVLKPWKSDQKHVAAPIYHSLGFDKLIFENVKKVLFVEGISDKFILEGLKPHLKKLGEYHIHPISGGNKLEDSEIVKELNLLKCLNKYTEINSYFILDGDRILIFNTDSESTNEADNIIYLGNENQEIEDLIDFDFYIESVQDYYRNIFLDNEKRIEFFQKTMTEFKENNKVKGKQENSSEKVTKRLSELFTRKNFGGFSKVGVSI
ncbi:unnamed protein product, partial [marine sediment metagenome]